MAISEENQRENRTTIATVKTSTKEITTDDSIIRDRSAPSCNDCVATIVTEPFTPTVKGVGTVRPAFRKRNKYVNSRIQESGGVLRLELELIKTSFLVMS